MIASSRNYLKSWFSSDKKASSPLTEQLIDEEEDLESSSSSHSLGWHEPTFETPEELAQRLELEQFQRELEDEVWEEEMLRRRHTARPPDDDSSNDTPGFYETD